MKKEEIYSEVIKVVSDVTGISEMDILKSKTEECCEARCLLVRYLSRIMPGASIGVLINRTRQGVRAILQREKSDSWMMVRNWKEIVKKMESKGF